MSQNANKYSIKTDPNPAKPITDVDITKEHLVSLVEAARLLPAVDGRKPHANSLWRWCTRGVQGVKLEHVRVGRRVCTSKEALSRFTNALAEQCSQDLQAKRQPAKSPTPRARRREVAAAEAKLAASGF